MSNPFASPEHQHDESNRKDESMKSESVRASLIVAFGLGIAILLMPLNVKLSYGQDGVSLSVEKPAQGQAPIPPAPPATNPVTEESAAEVSGAEISSEEEIGLSAAIEASEQKLANAASEEPVPLSVAPREPIYPDNMPAWINQDPDYSTPIHRLFVGSEPVSDEADLDKALQVPLMAAVLDYLDDQVFHEDGVASELGITSSYIQSNLISDRNGYTVPLNSLDGKMYEKWVTLEIHPEQRANFERMRAEARQLSRIPIVLLCLLGVVGVMGTSHLFLRRGSSLPTQEPLAGQNLVAQEMPARQSRGNAGMASVVIGLIFMGGVILVGGVLFLSLFAIRAESHFQDDAYPRTMVGPNVHVDVSDQIGQTITEAISEHVQVLPEGGVVITTSDGSVIKTKSSDQSVTESVIQSGGQTIIERRRNSP